MFHGRVVFHRKQKADSDLIDGLGYLLRGKLQVNPQSSQNIGAAALAAGGPVAMLGYFLPGSGGFFA